MGPDNTLNYSRTIELLLLSQMQPFPIQPKGNLHLHFQLKRLTKRESSFPQFAPLNNSIKHMKASFTAALFTEWAHVNCGATENIVNKKTPWYKTQNLVLVCRILYLS